MSGGVPAGELLPCPFCGGEAKLVSNTSSTVQCQNDQCIIGDPAPFNDFSHRHDAITAWNTRATPTPPIEGRDADVERDVRIILQAVADADSEDCIASIDVDIPKDGYPRQWLQHAARAALQALGERP